MVAAERSDRGGAARVEPADAPLDLHEGIWDPRTGCPRWPELMRLRNEATGELVEGRCRATNLCKYCQKLYVVETVEMLTLDALEHAPALWVVLTAREHLTREQTYSHLRQLRRAARKRWPAVEWFVQVEFQRRGALHLNLLVKGVPVEDQAQLHAVLVERWCDRVDAEPVGQWSGVVQDAGGVTRYIAKMLAHGLKAEQAPPIGWRGHRTSQTRGYLVRPASVMRQEARASLALKRELWKALERGFPADVAEIVAQDALQVAAATDWKLVQLDPRRELADDERAKPTTAPAVDVEPAAAIATAASDEFRVKTLPPDVLGRHLARLVRPVPPAPANGSRTEGRRSRPLAKREAEAEAEAERLQDQADDVEPLLRVRYCQNVNHIDSLPGA